MKVLSFGCGVQTVALAMMGCLGDWERFDYAVFGDTQWESAETYRYLKMFRAWAAERGLRIIVTSAGNIKTDALSSSKRVASMPLWTKDGLKKGKLRRQCTNEYKIRMVRKVVRSMKGLLPGERWFGPPAEISIGISTDEAQRMKPSRLKCFKHRWPLIEKRMNRQDSKNYIVKNGLPIPPKSACIGCPFHDDRSWLDMKLNRPKEWTEAVEFDRAIRTTVRRRSEQMKSEVFLHQSCVPLDEADLNESQIDRFGNECEGFCGV